MKTTANPPASRLTIGLNKTKTFFSKPYNVILLLMGIVFTVTTVAPILAIIQDTLKIHPGTIDAHLTGQVSGYTLVNYIDLFTSRMAKTNLWTPLLNTLLLAVGTCIVSILFGGIVAFLVTRTNMAWRKYISSIFIFPYIMPQWTLAVVWQKYTGEASILAIIMMIFGVAIMMLNQLSLTSRKNYTTGKSGQISKINLGKSGKYIIAVILVILTFFTSIFPIVSFAFETFLPNPGDYSFLYTGDTSNLTAKWWVTSENVTENGMYGQKGILHNETIWHAFRGTIFVSVCCALLAGTIGTLVGYAVSKNRRSKWANYVNSMAFLPYLMPSLAVGAAFFILFSTEKLNLFNTYTLLIIVGTIKYIPFASRSSLNSMLQLSGEIEEAAIIQDIPWIKRMTRIIIPIQKSSIISGYLLPFMTCLRELSLFMLLCVQGFILSTTLDYFDEMGLYAFSSGINLILIITILVCNTLVNKVTGASLDKGIGG